MDTPNDPKRQLLRHALATVAYRGSKACRDAPDGFADFRASESSRTPVQILAHIGDLFGWALSLARGKQAWHEAPPLPWDQEIQRFSRTLAEFDAYLASDLPMHAEVEGLLQAPVADALTHIGQIAMLRRIAGAAIRPENFFRAQIAAGRL